MGNSFKVGIEVNDQTEWLDITGENSLLEEALKKNIALNHSCGGMGTCGTCRVIVEDPKSLPPRESIEQEMADDRGFEENERLACQLYLKHSNNFRVPGPKAEDGE